VDEEEEEEEEEEEGPAGVSSSFTVSSRRIAIVSARWRRMSARCSFE
jgi:hypothetical protein